MAPPLPSLRALLDRAAAQLQAAGIGRARFEARLLLAEAGGLTIEQIVADDGHVLTPAQLEVFDQLVARRAARQPMSQVLGWREFFGRRFAVTPDVLTPRPDSETVIEAALAHIPDRAAPLRVLDLGVGSGCLLLTLLAEYRQARGMGIDKSAAALVVARANAQALGVADRADLRAGDWTQPDWAAAVGRFDLIVANPPYIPSDDLPALDPEVRDHEPHLALDGGPSGLREYHRLATGLVLAMDWPGLAILEVGAGQARAVAALLQAAGLTVAPPRQDLAGIPRCVIAASPQKNEFAS